MNCRPRTTPFVPNSTKLRACRSRSQPPRAQRPCLVSVRAGVIALATELPTTRTSLTKAQGIGYALLVLAILLIEFYAMGQIYLQLSNLPVQVRFDPDPWEMFQGR
jgi:hypothetical protein